MLPIYSVIRSHNDDGISKQKALLKGLVFGCVFFIGSYAKADTLAEEKAYCEQAGGQVEFMQAEFSTYTGLAKGNRFLFCNFTRNNGIITIGLETFSSTNPSLAATFIKRLAEIPPASALWVGHQNNPSHNVCRNLGGAFIGFSAAGSFTDKLGQSDICVFGDGSMVSAWSLIYMANHRDGYDEIKNKVRAQPLEIPMLP